MSASPAATARPEVTIRSLSLSVYAPTLLFAIGQGAVIPVVVLAARDLGASVAVAGLVAALRGIGVLCFDVPAGWLVSRFGEGRAMAAGTLLVAVALAGSALAPALAVFAVFTFVMGCGWSVWLLARLAYLSDAVPINRRGRALSTLGGVNRVGNFIGPLLGVVAIKLMDVEGAYVVHFVTAIGAFAMLSLFLHDAGGAGDLHREPNNPLEILREHSGVFLTVGAGVTAIQVLRAARQLVLPLWAEHIGLADSQVSLIFGISVGMEMLLFYPAGSVMDRAGRKWVALPCLGIMSAGMLLIPLTQSFLTLSAVGIVLGFGNGLGSGIVMTLGADFSPAIGRAQFLGTWRLFGDIGTAGGPLAVAGVTGLAGLGPSAVLMGLLGLGGVALLSFRMPEPLRLQNEDPPRSSPVAGPG
ncbi:MAG: MFS transporter [Hyphomicrobiales bacterium]